MQEIPALVQGDLELLDPLSLRVAHLATRLPLEQLVLLVGQLVDALDQILVLHVPSIGFGPFHYPTSCSEPPPVPAGRRRYTGPTVDVPEEGIPVQRETGTFTVKSGLAEMLK